MVMYYQMFSCYLALEVAVWRHNRIQVDVDAYRDHQRYATFAGLRHSPSLQLQNKTLPVVVAKRLENRVNSFIAMTL